MTAYVMFGQTEQTKETREDSVLFERASNGALRARSMWPNEKLALSIAHTVSRADVETLLDLYRTNKTLPVDVTYAGDGQTYSMYFNGPPQVEPLFGIYWKVVVNMVQA